VSELSELNSTEEGAGQYDGRDRRDDGHAMAHPNSLYVRLRGSGGEAIHDRTASGCAGLYRAAFVRAVLADS
jgi:hypothetical protein